MTTFYDIKNQGGTFSMGETKDREDNYTLFVPGVHRATCRWGNHGIPTYLALHPIDEDLVAAYLTAEEAPDDIGCFVHIRYVPRDVVRQSAKWLRLEPIDGAARMRYTSDPDVLRVPYFKRIPINNTGPNNTVITSHVWTFDYADRPEASTIIEASWTASGITPSGLAPLHDEVSNLHLIGGATCLFLGGTADQIDYSRWEITARWKIDTGTPNTGGSVAGSSLQPDFAGILYLGVAKDPAFIRKPFHEIAVAETGVDGQPIAGYPKDNPPAIWQRPVFRTFIPAGASNLPGAPPL